MNSSSEGTYIQLHDVQQLKAERESKATQDKLREEREAKERIAKARQEKIKNEREAKAHQENLKKECEAKERQKKLLADGRNIETVYSYWVKSEYTNADMERLTNFVDLQKDLAECIYKKLRAGDKDSFSVCEKMFITEKDKSFHKAIFSGELDILDGSIVEIRLHDIDNYVNAKNVYAKIQKASENGAEYKVDSSELDLMKRPGFKESLRDVILDQGKSELVINSLHAALYDAQSPLYRLFHIKRGKGIFSKEPDVNSGVLKTMLKSYNDALVIKNAEDLSNGLNPKKSSGSK